MTLIIAGAGPAATAAVRDAVPLDAAEAEQRLEDAWELGEHCQGLRAVIGEHDALLGVREQRWLVLVDAVDVEEAALDADAAVTAYAEWPLAEVTR